MAIFMFLFSVALCISVALLTNPPDYARISGLSFGTLTAQDKASARSSLTAVDIVFSLILVGMVIGILSYFTG